MREITIKCYDSGKAIVTNTSSQFNNENNASRIIVDFSNTEYVASLKWCDIVLPNGSSLRYPESGNIIAETLEIDLTYASTFKSGQLVVTPFITDGDTKVKYRPDKDILIRYQADAGDEEAPDRDDYIFDLNTRVTALETLIDNKGLQVFEAIQDSVDKFKFYANLDYTDIFDGRIVVLKSSQDIEDDTLQGAMISLNAGATYNNLYDKNGDALTLVNAFSRGNVIAFNYNSDLNGFQVLMTNEDYDDLLLKVGTNTDNITTSVTLIEDILIALGKSGQIIRQVVDMTTNITPTIIETKLVFDTETTVSNDADILDIDSNLDAILKSDNSAGYRISILAGVTGTQNNLTIQSVVRFNLYINDVLLDYLDVSVGKNEVVNKTKEITYIVTAIPKNIIIKQQLINGKAEINNLTLMVQSLFVESVAGPASSETVTLITPAEESVSSNKIKQADRNKEAVARDKSKQVLTMTKGTGGQHNVNITNYELKIGDKFEMLIESMDADLDSEVQIGINSFYSSLFLNGNIVTNKEISDKHISTYYNGSNFILNNIAKDDGDYPNMIVGTAEKLESGIIVEDIFISRMTATEEIEVEDVNAVVDKISGITDKIMLGIKFDEDPGILSPFRGTFDWTGNELLFTINDDSQTYIGFSTNIETSFNFYENKKIYIEYDIESLSTNTSVNYVTYATAPEGSFTNHADTLLTNGQLLHWSLITIPNSSFTSKITIYIKNSIDMTIGDSFHISNLVIRAIGELGDGNLTAEEIQYKYGIGYKETGLVYDTPDKIVSTGVNLFDKEYFATECINQLGSSYATRIVVEGRDVLSLKGFVDNTAKIYLNFLPNIQYTFQVEARYLNNYGMAIRIYYTDGSSHIIFNPQSNIFTKFILISDAGKTVDYIGFIAISNSYDYYDLNTFQIELGDTATSYEPYTEDVFSIPQPTIAEELSYSTPTLRNYVEFVGEKKYFHKVLAKVDLGTLTYTYTTTFTATISDMSTLLDDLLCDNYSYGNDITKSTNTIIITDTDYTDATTFKTSMSGKYLIYPLAVEVVTEIESSETFYKVNNYGIEYINNGVSCNLTATYLNDCATQILTNTENIARLNIFKIYSATEFASITRIDGYVYGVYDEITGEITWYYGNVGV